MITASYKGQKVQLVAGKKGVVYAKVGGVIVATDCKTAQEAQLSARRFIDELEASGDYSVTPEETHATESISGEALGKTIANALSSEDGLDPTSEFVEVAGRKKNGK
jgi:hypothetical protein